MPRHSPSSSHGRPAFHDGQPPDARDQGGLLRRRRDRTGSRRSTACASTARRLAGQPRRPPGDIIAAFQNMANHGVDFFCVGIDHALALKKPGDRTSAPAAASPCVGTRRRLRLRHHQQGHRHHRRQRLRQGRAGPSQVRLRKKGLPTTYYLTIADSHINMHCELEMVDLVCINDPTPSSTI